MGHPNDPLMRVGTSGTEATAKNYSNTPATAGFFFQSVGPDAVPVWVPPGAIGLVNLSNVVWVDLGTTVPLAGQTGNIEAPFHTFAQALAALPDGGTIIATPGDYFEAPLVIATSGSNSISIVNASGLQTTPPFTSHTTQLVNLPAIASCNNALFLQGCSSTGRPITAVSAPLWLIACFIESATVTSFELHATLTTLIDTAAVVVVVASENTFDNCYFYRTASGILATIEDAGRIKFRDSQFAGLVPTIAFTAPGNRADFDESSMIEFIAVHGTLTNCDAFSQNMPPLTNVYYLDASTSAINGDQIGHIEKPLKTLSQLAAVSDFASVLIVPGDYSGAPVAFASAASVALVNASCLDHNGDVLGAVPGINVILPQVSCVGGFLLVQGCACSAGIAQTNVVTLKQGSVAIGVACAAIFAEEILFVGAPITLTSRGDFTNCEFHTAAPGNTIIQADNLAPLTFRNCAFRVGDNPVIVFASGTNAVDFDEQSLISFLAAGGTITFGSYKPIAGPLSGIASISPTTLAPGQTTVATMILPDVFPPDVLATAGVVTAAKLSGIIISATFIAITHTLEIYADNYTVAPIVVTDAIDLRWKIFAP